MKKSNAITADKDFLAAAIAGYQSFVRTSEERIAQLRKLQKDSGESPVAPRPKGRPKSKRTMSAAGRARIAAAQKARWANYHKQQAKAAVA